MRDGRESFRSASISGAHDHDEKEGGQHDFGDEAGDH